MNFFCAGVHVGGGGGGYCAFCRSFASVPSAKSPIVCVAPPHVASTPKTRARYACRGRCDGKRLYRIHLYDWQDIGGYADDACGDQLCDDFYRMDGR